MFPTYDATRESLYHPGNANNFFQLGTIKDDAALCAEMSRLAYVKEESRLVEYLKRAGFQKDKIIGYADNGTQLFIASRPDDNLTVVAFRGTEPDDPSDIFTDAKFLLTPWTDEAGRPLGQVHKGFADALLKDGLLQQIVTCLNSMEPPTRVLLTGHSLGAALATISASWITAAHLYTFGSPLVGDATFAQAVKDIKHFRYVDCCDLVTRVPPGFGYVHVGSRHYLDRDGQLLSSPSDAVIAADCLAAEFWYLQKALLPGNVLSRDFADHTPINYVSGVMGVRIQA